MTAPARDGRGAPRPAAAAPVVRAVALCTAVLALLWTARHGPAEPATALAFGLLMTAGELARRPEASGAPYPLHEPLGREPAPLGAAGALAYALLAESTGESAAHGTLQAVAVVLAAVLVGAVPQAARGEPGVLDHVARRVLTTAFAGVCCAALPTVGEFVRTLGRGPAPALPVLLVAGLTVLCDTVLAAALLRARAGGPYGPVLREELRALGGTGAAVGAAAAVLALATGAAGLWALPVFCLPLLGTQLSFRRCAAARTTYRQTIASLARATEIGGHTPPGHARRVAELSLAVGRELRLPGHELAVLEYAALMHDIGQLSLLDPVPGGATVLLPHDEQRRIALLGGAVVRRTGVPAGVAAVVEQQADPYREQCLPARIVRAANAYEDLSRGSGGSAGGALAALEQLRLGTGRDFAPEVVESLARVLDEAAWARGPGPRTA
ncbi:HD-GYP domain-containing protein [Streptomyces sp. NPDC090026]|uniref:HD-GYP domain-containing protein n=1 Tax=Streptomyces sp. NPDC090026 TaxID=3365923 RepID=UPI0037FD4D93